MIDERCAKRHRGQYEPSPVDRRRHISVYWLWLVVFFGVIAMVPWHAYQKLPPGPVSYLPVVSAYRYPHRFDWQTTLAVHALLAVLLATPVAVIQTVIGRVRGEPEPVTFNLQQLLLGTGILALGLGSLIWCAAPMIMFFVVVFLFSGWPATVILAGFISRRIVAHRKTAAKVG